MKLKQVIQTKQMNQKLNYTKHTLQNLKKQENKNKVDYNKLNEDLEKLRQTPYLSMNINIKSSKCLICKCMKSGTYKNYEKNIIMSYLNEEEKIRK